MRSAGAFAEPPSAERPTTPGRDYGVPETGGEMVDWTTIVDRLRSAQAYWLATVTPTGRPHVVPIWGVMVGDDLYLETGAPSTAKNRNLATNPAIAVHLDDPNDAVIVMGTAEPARPERELGTLLAAAFSAKYKGYSPGPTDWEGGGLIRVDPTTILAWRDMPTATRWRLAAGGGSREPILSPKRAAEAHR
jgi:nitroimidazol reductase NimA-like FMN-containing flavoprotein (pyridoxamine 5'-phosphate oxidase superfamily)